MACDAITSDQDSAQVAMIRPADAAKDGQDICERNNYDHGFKRNSACHISLPGEIPSWTMNATHYLRGPTILLLHPSLNDRLPPPSWFKRFFALLAAPKAANFSDRVRDTRMILLARRHLYFATLASGFDSYRASNCITNKAHLRPYT